MAVTVSAKNYTLINACENSGDWTGGVPGDVTDFFKEGTQCVGFELRLAGNTDIYITGSWDLSGVKHFRFWMMTTVLNELNIDANGGVQVYVSDGVNTGYYYVSGSTTYPGGWYNPVVDLSRAVDTGTKPDMTVLTTIGLRFNLTAGAKKVQSLWIDHLYVGDGLIAYGDDAGGSFDFDNILAADENTTNGWGMIRKIGGVFFVTGNFEFGDSAGVNSCDFNAISDALIFENRKVNSNLYNFTIVDNGTGTTEFQLGSKSGTSGIEGCVIRVEDIAQTPKFDIIATDTDISDFKLYGTTFLDADAILLPTVGTNKEVLNCNFESCGEVIVSTCKVENSNIISANGRGVKISSTSHNFSKNNIINCADGIRFDVANTYSLSDVVFSGGTYHIENTAAGAVTINCLGTSNASTKHENPGSITINNTKTLTITCKNSAGLAVEGVKVRIENDPSGTLISEGTTNSSGIYTDNTYNYAGDEDVKIIARLKGYKNNAAFDTITTDGLSIPFTMIRDDAVNMP